VRVDIGERALMNDRDDRLPRIVYGCDATWPRPEGHGHEETQT